MTREIALFIVLAIGAIALWAAWRGWRSRVKRFSHLPALEPIEHLTGGERGVFQVMHMATTPAHDPLERVARSPLAFRAKTLLRVTTDGIGLDITGEGSAWIPATSISGVGVATWTIDKVVDSEGLVFVRWMWGADAVDSYFRVVDHPRDDVVQAVGALVDGSQEGVS